MIDGNLPWVSLFRSSSRCDCTRGCSSSLALACCFQLTRFEQDIGFSCTDKMTTSIKAAINELEQHLKPLILLASVLFVDIRVDNLPTNCDFPTRDLASLAIDVNDFSRSFSRLANESHKHSVLYPTEMR